MRADGLSHHQPQRRERIVVSRPFDRARDEVDRDYEEGLIDGAEANRLMREIAEEEDDYWRDDRERRS